MAHYVGKELHIRPNEILDTWGVPELIVAYGEYANETAYEKVRRLILEDAKNEQRITPKTLDKSGVLSHNTVPA